MLILLGCVIIGIILYVIIINNRIIKTENKVEEALSDIDVALSRRYTTLTNLVEVVKGYAKHEKEVILKVVELRANPSMQERTDVDSNHTQVQSKLFALSENYPDLKASEQFLSLQKTIVELEEHLSASRRMYNSNVSIYNNLIECFPSSLVARFINASVKDYFKANDNEKENIQLKL